MKELRNRVKDLYVENGHSEEFYPLPSWGVPFEGALHVTPVPELVRYGRGATVDLEYFHGEPTRKCPGEGLLR